MPKVNRKAGIHLFNAPYKGIDGKMNQMWYWILIARNGKTIARSSETYKRKRSAVDSIRVAAKLFADSAGAIGWNFYDHSSGHFQPDFVVF